jgi:hypothetical protein
MQRREAGWSRASSIALGLVLIVAGVVFLGVQLAGIVLPFEIADVGWPLFIIAPGGVLLVVGLLLPGAPGVGLAVAGSIVTTVGLVLAYQQATGHWTSWAYAWALVGPGAVGAGTLVWGTLHLSRDAVRTGLGALGVGVVLFLIGFGFFEGLLNLGGERGLAPLGRQALPVALIVAGVLVIVMRLWPRRADRWSTSAPPAAPGGAPSAAPDQDSSGAPVATEDPH